MKKALLFFVLLALPLTHVHGNNIFHKRKGTDMVPFYKKEVRAKKTQLVSRGRNFLLPAAITAGLASAATLAVKKDTTCEIEVIGDLFFNFDWSTTGAGSDIDFLILLPNGSVFETFNLSTPHTNNSNTITGVKSGEIYTVRIVLVNPATVEQKLTMHALLNDVLIETQVAFPAASGQEFTFVMP